MTESNNCYWSASRSCNINLYQNEKDIFIIGSNHISRTKSVGKIKDIITNEFNMNPIFAIDLKKNNNLDAFCDNICSNIRGSRLIIVDLSGPLITYCKEHDMKNFQPSINVYWEYGYACGIEKDLLVICDEEQKQLPFDIAGKHVEFYTEENIEAKLVSLIKEKLEKYPSRYLRTPVESPIIKTLENEIQHSKERLNNIFEKYNLVLEYIVLPMNADKEIVQDLKGLKQVLDRLNPRVLEGTYSLFYWSNYYPRVEVDQVVRESANPIDSSYVFRKEGLIYLLNHLKFEEREYYGIKEPLRILPLKFIMGLICANLDFIKESYSKLGYEGKIQIRFNVHGLHDFVYNPSEDKLVIPGSFSQFQSQKLREIFEIFDLSSLSNVDDKMNALKIFIAPIINGYNRTECPQFNQVRQLLKKMISD